MTYMLLLDGALELVEEITFSYVYLFILLDNKGATRDPGPNHTKNSLNLNSS